MKIFKKKIYAVIELVVLILIQYIIIQKALYEISASLIALRAISIATLISIFFYFHTWKLLTGELLSPYAVFLSTMLIFCCGQTFGWAFQINLGAKDLINRVDYDLTHKLLLKGLSYSLLSMSCFHLGALINYHGYKTKYTKWSPEDVLKAFEQIGKLLLIICIPAFFAETIEMLQAVSLGGYSAYYDVLANQSFAMKILDKLSDYYQPILLILLVSNRHKKVKRNIIIFAMMFDIVCKLYIGGRSGAVMSVLGILLAFHYFVKPFGKKELTILAVLGYFGMGCLNAIADIRGLSNKSVFDLLTSFGTGFANVFGDFVGELGWSLTSICWTMNLTASAYPFRNGMSYLVALISPIPNFGFWDVHPAEIWGDLASWLKNALGMGYGPGYTIVAESYLNFGWYGLIAMFVIGCILVRVLADVNHKNTEKNILGATFQIIVIMTIMKSLVRSSMTVTSRTIVYVIIPLYFLILYYLRRNANESRNSDLAQST